MNGHFDPARFDDATAGDRRSMVDHLRRCPACRAAAAAYEPTILFALLDRTHVPERILDDVSVVVARRAGGGGDSIGAVIASAPLARRRLAAAAVVALALVSGYVTVRQRPAVTAATAAHDSVPLSSRRADVDVHPAPSVSRVVDFTVGETQVVMVYNGDLNL